MNELAARKCEPREGGVKPMTLKQAKDQLSKLDGWKLAAAHADQ